MAITGTIQEWEKTGLASGWEMYLIDLPMGEKKKARSLGKWEPQTRLSSLVVGKNLVVLDWMYGKYRRAHQSCKTNFFRLLVR
jgi:hypothetical protein